jgi:hypothetical protein
MLIHGANLLGTARTPEIVLSSDAVITIRGRWMMENSSNFSKILSDWYDENLLDLPYITAINIHLEYFGGLNLYILITFLRKILYGKILFLSTQVNWYYDQGDEDILDLGDYISNILGKPFNFITIREKHDYPHSMKEISRA